MNKPSLNIKEHKDWYYCSIEYHREPDNPLEHSFDFRIERVVIFAKTRKEARKVIDKIIQKEKLDHEWVHEINLYRNTYIKEAKRLIDLDRFFYLEQ